jgi:hypothetical protein
MPPKFLADTPHLLEWYASYCVTLAENCERPRTQRLMRLLAADLAIEAHRRRRSFNRGSDRQLLKAQRPTEHRSQPAATSHLMICGEAHRVSGQADTNEIPARAAGMSSSSTVRVIGAPAAPPTR